MSHDPKIDRSKITVYLSENDLTALRNLSDDLGIACSALARMTIRKYLKQAMETKTV